MSRREPPVPPSILRQVVAGARGNPRTALRALSDLIVHDEEPERALSARSALERRAGELGRPHGMLMAELLERGSASPSDEALQRSLGVTRARLTQLLREMFEDGLVVAGHSPITGPGRPRTLYRPNLEQG